MPTWKRIPLVGTGEIPDDLMDEDPRLYRLVIVKQAIDDAGYDVLDEEEARLAISHLLADLRHLCDALDQSFADLDAIAYNYYLNDKEKWSHG